MATVSCTACHLRFTTHEDHRAHYKTDLHRFNLKRKVAQLPPIDPDTYAAHLEEQKSKEESSGKVATHCITCNRTYSSQNAYEAHLQSKRHIELAKTSKANQEHAETANKDVTTSAQPAGQQKIPEEFLDEEEIIEQRIKDTNIKLRQCFFCLKNSASLKKNIVHLAKEHGFQIPDIEYVSDLEGLLEYFAQKVLIGYTCLYCGKTFRSSEAARNHMLSVNHSKIKFDDDLSEYEDFYDFSRSYTDILNPKEEANEPLTEADIEALNAMASSKVRISDDGYSLIFVDTGKVVGHRALREYYKQNIRPIEQNEAITINKVLNQYKALGWKASSALVIQERRTMLERKKLQFKEQQKLQRWQQRIGTRANKLQKYFRQDNPI